MTEIQRPALKDVFLTEVRRLQVYFYTSNIEKYLQARAIGGRLGLNIRHYRSSQDPYEEDYSGDKYSLLERAISEIRKSLNARSIFFVEDTSVRIEALSSQSKDFPGLMIKEWFASTNFKAVDKLLHRKNNDRRATVKSDIALYIPGFNKPVFFYGETKGKISTRAPKFKQSVQHPWLTPKTFNGWIIPDGATKPLGNMSFDEAWNHDFRVKGFLQLFARLEEYSYILNLDSHAYTRHAPYERNAQLQLLPLEPVYVVVGPTCTGKTTMGEHLSREKHSFLWIEASAIMRTLCESSQITGLDSFQMAKELLTAHGMDAVANHIVHILEQSKPRPIVITGFRTLEEIEIMLRKIQNVHVVHVDSPERLRYERFLERGRSKSKTTLTDFRAIDSQQAEFGLTNIASDVSEYQIKNEADLKEYFEQIDAFVTSRDRPTKAGIIKKRIFEGVVQKRQLVRLLKILEKTGCPMECGEIEAKSSEYGERIRDNNANKILKSVPGLASRHYSQETNVRYQISGAGRSYLRVIKLLAEKTRQHAKISSTQ